eukprot:TRINITY_DN3716_c0_g1_i10.p1 TRINITY_DN3716_c0_g1~~TRINITY_DN3716_c0_g1_i10.p1  ORF type:complete len:377 (+),score=80.78 TRINITY_DN3716_c0_g1_i10:274-1404(+)
MTGGTEQLILDASQKLAKHEPIYLIAHPGDNSLPASLETMARLQQDGRSGRIIYIQDRKDLRALSEAVDDLFVVRSLHAARIGLVGKPSDWLVASSPSPRVVHEMWGPVVVPIKIEEWLNRFVNPTKKHIDAAKAFVSDIQAKAAFCKEPTKDSLADAAKALPSLLEICEQHRLHALTVRCFDLVLACRSTGCLALAELNDRGIIAGCEGDLNSTIGMLLAYKLLNQRSWMANPAQIDFASNILRLAHCTVPRSIVSKYGLRSHFESGLGAAIEGDFPSGEVTLLRIGGKRLEKIWLSEGVIKDTAKQSNLCRTQMSVEISNDHTNSLLLSSSPHSSTGLQSLLSNPLGNHIVVIPGRHQMRLFKWWQCCILPHAS